MRVRTLLPVLFLALSLAVAALYLLPSARASAPSTDLAPTFSVPDIYGHNFSLSNYRNSSVVVTEFTALSCSECQIVEKSLASLYASYNATGTTKVHIVSVYTEPQFGDSIPALRTYHDKNNITWTMAQDTSSLAVSRAYGVTALPTVFIIDKHGQVVYNVAGVQDDNRLHATITAALAGTATAISLVTVSVFALAALAGVSTFFSPCAFPMLPGYMGLFLGLNAREAESSTSAKGTYRGAAGRAAFAGSVTAFGMILVFLVIGVILIFAASLVSGYIPDLLIAVGVVLIVLGALLLTNLQYWRIVKPLQRLGRRIRGLGPDEPVVSTAPTPGKGLYVKLFSYGMGYAAAATGCVAPVVFSAVIAGLALGLTGGIISILIFSATAALLMIVVTVVIALAGKKYVNQLKAFAPVIKKVSAVVLVVVGAYLIYFYYTAWIR
ncbi:MAG: redoxin domain-containing protein [Thermoplasmata archaeon]|nr:redoxin domain-containing protein [Thermoplasmata archaeon]